MQSRGHTNVSPWAVTGMVFLRPGSDGKLAGGRHAPRSNTTRAVIVETIRVTLRATVLAETVAGGSRLAGSLLVRLVR